ncbi:hypothetical protein BDN72DRAFT_841378 [Pluteus cervinus]|uniref:Uncharacterized protein n=1 Tax=Pluteus cervinus TaxID=181527 RepID=A0ACD3AT73_9AGAR|nr:hypothetical protein BDN72DRAFT_841378 [Pluteus cervinus]
MFCFPSAKKLPDDEDSTSRKKESTRESKVVEEFKQQDDYKASTGDLSAQMLSMMLETIKTAGEAAPVPFLEHAASVALVILETVQNVKENKEQFKQLADECCALVYTLYRTRGTIPDSEITVDYVRAAQTLDNTISEISRFALRSASRKWWQRVLRVQSDTDKIGEYRQKLNHALVLFNMDQSQTIFALAYRCYQLQVNSQSQTPSSIPVDTPGIRSTSAPTDVGIVSQSTQRVNDEAFRSREGPIVNVSAETTPVEANETPASSTRTEASPGDGGRTPSAISPPITTTTPPAIPTRPPPAPMFGAGFPFNGTLSGNIQMTNVGGDYSVSKVNKKVINTNSHNTYVKGRRAASSANTRQDSGFSSDSNND